MSTNRIKFKEREVTKGIALHYNMVDVPLKDFEVSMKRMGWFSVGYHYVIHRDGSIEKGIDTPQYADPSVKGYRDHVCVLIMGQVQGEMNPLQVNAVHNLAEKLNLEIKS